MMRSVARAKAKAARATKARAKARTGLARARELRRVPRGLRMTLAKRPAYAMTVVRPVTLPGTVLFARINSRHLKMRREPR